MSHKIQQEVSKRVITTEPSYKMATAYYPHIQMQNEGRQTTIHNRNIESNQEYLIERRKRENFPTSPNQEISYYQRTERSEMAPSATSRRKSFLQQKEDVSQKNYSRLYADQSMNYSAYENKDGSVLRAKDRREYAESVSRGGVEATKESRGKPWFCRLPFLCLLGFLALLGLGVGLFFLLKGGNENYSTSNQATSQPAKYQGLRSFYDAFDSPNIVTQQTSYIRKNGTPSLEASTAATAATTATTTAASSTFQTQGESETVLSNNFGYKYYIDENGMKKTLKVPLEITRIGDYEYMNPLKFANGNLETKPGVSSPYKTVTTTLTETEVLAK